MQLIRCTKKLQTAMGIKPEALVQYEVESSLLGSWHANLLVINRSKCVLFVNDKTRFSFIIPAVQKGQWHKLDTLFKELLQCVLADEGFDTSIIQQVLSEYDQIGFANTSNRNVIGSMNDLAYHYPVRIEEAGGVHSPMIPEIIRNVNRVPFKAVGFTYPIEVLRNLLNSKQ
jgi:hypothetical protein